jgi:hypothetical protein
MQAYIPIHYTHRQTFLYRLELLLVRNQRLKLLILHHLVISKHIEFSMRQTFVTVSGPHNPSSSVLILASGLFISVSLERSLVFVT